MTRRSPPAKICSCLAGCAQICSAFGGFRRDRDILQVDPPQAYGIGAYVKMIAKVEELGGTRARIFPHGGNMMSFALVAGLGLGGCEAYPGVFAAFGGFAEGMEVHDGQIALPDMPGVGFRSAAFGAA